MKHGAIYDDAFNAAELELREAIEERKKLDQRIEDLRETLIGLSNLCNKPIADITLLGVADAGLTEAIKMVLKFSDKPLTPVDIKRRLEDANFDLKRFANPMAVIHTAIGRMVGRDNIAQYETADGKPAYGDVRGIAGETSVAKTMKDAMTAPDYANKRAIARRRVETTTDPIEAVKAHKPMVVRKRR
jgi:hypothetical protein